MTWEYQADNGTKIRFTLPCNAQCATCGKWRPLEEFGFRAKDKHVIYNQPRPSGCRNRKIKPGEDCGLTSVK